MRRSDFVVLAGLVIALAVPLAAEAQQAGKREFFDALDKLDVDAAREALRNGADPNERLGGSGMSALARTTSMYFLRSGQPMPEEDERKMIAVLEVLFQAGARLAPWDRTILHTPAIYGAPLVTKYLLERGADPNGADSDGDTPVILATRYGHDEIVSLLVASGAKRLNPKSAAQIGFVGAAGRGDLIALRKQLARGARVNERTPDGMTALVQAVGWGRGSGGHLLMVQELLRLGANPNLSARLVVGGPATAPLHLAVLKNEQMFEEDNGPAVVAALLKAGAHVSSTESYEKHQTPLHLAARMNNAKAVTLLLKAGAKVMPRDEEGKTPLDLATAAPVIRLLKAAGATER